MSDGSPASSTSEGITYLPPFFVMLSIHLHKTLERRKGEAWVRDEEHKFIRKVYSPLVAGSEHRAKLYRFAP